MFVDPSAPFVVYGAPSTGKSIFADHLRALGILVVDSDDIMEGVVGKEAMPTFATDTPPGVQATVYAEIDEADADVLLTNLKAYIDVADYAFSRSKEDLEAEMKKRAAASGEVWDDSKYPWLKTFKPDSRAYVLPEGTYISDILLPLFKGEVTDEVVRTSMSAEPSTLSKIANRKKARTEAQASLSL